MDILLMFVYAITLTVTFSIYVLVKYYNLTI
jgi:hypothetical protein